MCRENLQRLIPVAAVLMAGVLPACSYFEDFEMPTPATGWEFTCSDGFEFGIEYLDGDSVGFIREDGSTAVLTQTPVASGARYSDGIIAFWTQGRKAHIERSGVIVHDECVGEPG